MENIIKIIKMSILCCFFAISTVICEAKNKETKDQTDVEVTDSNGPTDNDDSDNADDDDSDSDSKNDEDESGDDVDDDSNYNKKRNKKKHKESEIQKEGKKMLKGLEAQATGFFGKMLSNVTKGISS